MYPVIQNIRLEKNIAMNVPAKEYISTVPIFLINGFFYILYPLSKIIGGRSRIMKRLTKCSVILSRVD